MKNINNMNMKMQFPFNPYCRLDVSNQWKPCFQRAETALPISGKNPSAERKQRL